MKNVYSPKSVVYRNFKGLAFSSGTKPNFVLPWLAQTMDIVIADNRLFFVSAAQTPNTKVLNAASTAAKTMVVVGSSAGAAGAILGAAASLPLLAGGAIYEKFYGAHRSTEEVSLKERLESGLAIWIEIKDLNTCFYDYSLGLFTRLKWLALDGRFKILDQEFDAHVSLRDEGEMKQLRKCRDLVFPKKEVRKKEVFMDYMASHPFELSREIQNHGA